VRIRLHPDAELELEQACVWYEGRRLHLGDEFLAEVTRWLELLAEASAIWPRWEGAPETDPPIRKAVTGRFPYVIAYQAFADHIRILAFAHASRRPFYWAKRTES